MIVKFDTLQTMLQNIHEGLNDVVLLDEKYIGYIEHLKVLAGLELEPSMIIKYKTFKSSLDFENFQKETPIRVVSVMPIYQNFKASSKTAMHTEPAILVTYFAIEVESFRKGNKC
jgi:hypothetical protein